MIELRDVTKVFPGPDGAGHVAVRELSLRVMAGQTACLIGTSGCGKTTTLRLINRLIEPTSGEILIDGAAVHSIDVIRLRRRIGYVIQQGGLFPHLTARRNVGLLCELEGWSADETSRRVTELLELVDLAPDEFGSRFPRELSGGERQRVGVARALALDPDYVLMDEPFGALDPITRTQLQRDFAELQRQVHKTVVLVTHDMGEAFRLGDQIALLDAGELVQVGTPEDFRQRPASAFVADFVESQLGDTVHQGAGRG